jgi:dsRNA-specific ribonuclease
MNDHADRKFWESVFLGRIEYYKNLGWGDSSSAAAAADADSALKEWRDRWQKAQL